MNGLHAFLIVAVIFGWIFFDHFRHNGRKGDEAEGRSRFRAAACERAVRAGIAPRTGQVSATQVSCPVELEDAA